MFDKKLAMFDSIDALIRIRPKVVFIIMILKTSISSVLYTIKNSI